MNSTKGVAMNRTFWRKFVTFWLVSYAKSPSHSSLPEYYSQGLQSAYHRYNFVLAAPHQDTSAAKGREAPTQKENRGILFPGEESSTLQSMIH